MFLQKRIAQNENNNQAMFRKDGYTEHNAKVVCELQKLVNECSKRDIENFRTIAQELKFVEANANLEMVIVRYQNM